MKTWVMEKESETKSVVSFSIDKELLEQFNEEAWKKKNNRSKMLDIMIRDYFDKSIKASIPMMSEEEADKLYPKLNHVVQDSVIISTAVPSKKKTVKPVNAIVVESPFESEPEVSVKKEAPPVVVKPPVVKKASIWEQMEEVKGEKF